MENLEYRCYDTAGIRVYNGVAFARGSPLVLFPVGTVEVTAIRIVSEPRSPTAYVAGEIISVAVDFGKPVVVPEGMSPTVVLEIDATNRLAAYNRAESSETTLRFDYTVVAEDDGY